MEALDQTGLAQQLRSGFQLGKPFWEFAWVFRCLFESLKKGKLAGLRNITGICAKSFLWRGNYKIPHMGWNSVEWGNLSDKSNSNWIRGW